MLTLNVSYLLLDTSPDSHVSDRSSFASYAGDSPRSEPAQYLPKLVHNTLAAQFSLSNEDSARIQAPAARIIPEISPILTHINPKRGPKSGGDDVCLIVENLPPAAVVYARFGGNIAPTVSNLVDPDLAECKECTENSPPRYSLTLRTGYLLAVSPQRFIQEPSTSHSAKRLPFMESAMGSPLFPLSTNATPLQRQFSFRYAFQPTNL